MHFTAENVLWTLTWISLLGFPFFLALFLLGARKGLRTREASRAPALTDELAKALPGVTVLKPCAGADDDLEGCLRSYLQTEYPSDRVQFVFGVRDERDAAWPVLQRLRDEFAGLDIELVLSGEPQLPSPKISNVEVMARRAKHELYWLSDSNTRVHPATLRESVAQLLEPGVGLVANPVSGDEEQTQGAAFDVLQLLTLAGLGTYSIFGATKMCAAPGKSVLFSRAALERIGGWRELGNYFGEDFVLMDRVRRDVGRLVLGERMVTNVSRSASFSRAMARHLRWTQIRWRVVFPSTGFEPLLSPIVPALGLLLAAPTLASARLFAAAFVLNLLGDTLVLWRFRGRGMALRFVPLMVARPLLNLYLTVRGAFPGKVIWRGNPLYMGPQSRCLAEPQLRTRLRDLRESLRPQA